METERADDSSAPRPALPVRLLQSLTRLFVGLARRYMPDPFLFALLLTFVALILARTLTPSGTVQLAGFWYEGLWKVLTFAMQMILILLTGYALALSRPVRRALGWVASRPRTPGQAVVLVVLAGMLSSLINWGFGLVIAALLAREVGRRVPVDFAYLVAGAYSGFVVWGSGLSGSILLVSATEGSPMNIIASYTGRAVTPVRETLLAPFNLALVAGMLVLLPVLFRAIAPAPERARPFREGEAGGEPALSEAPHDGTPAARLENHPLPVVLLALLGGTYLVAHFYQRGFDLNLNVLILLFLVAGLLAHGRPIAYVRAFNEAAKVSGPLVLQYPLYGGIMGIIVDSGLAASISNAFVEISTARTLPVWTYLSAALINMFVPSGGGQWVVQGPVMIPASLKLGVDPAVTAMAVAFGDQTTNMLQPFWALPALAIAGLGIRDVMGYCVMTCLLSGALSILVLLLLA